MTTELPTFDPKLLAALIELYLIADDYVRADGTEEELLEGLGRVDAALEVYPAEDVLDTPQEKVLAILRSLKTVRANAGEE